jgi:Mce-associated membrane protein
VSAAVKSATKTKVEVLLFVDQSITNAAISSPRIDRNRIDMTMDLIDGRWLASKVEIL